MTNLNTVLMVGALAMGVIYYVYEFWNSAAPYGEGPHRGRGSSSGDDDEEFEVTGQEVSTKESSQRVVKTPTTEEDCPICLERLISLNITRKTCLQALPDCGHWFHKKCLIRLLEYHPHCPVCRTNIDSSMITNAPVRIIQVEDEFQNISYSEPSTSGCRETRRKCFLNTSNDD